MKIKVHYSTMCRYTTRRVQNRKKNCNELCLREIGSKFMSTFYHKKILGFIFSTVVKIQRYRILILGIGRF